MDEIIKLKSRYRAKNCLKRISMPDSPQSKTYVLETDTSTVWVGKTQEGNDYIDPSGGPMIIVGQELEEAKMVVKSIGFVKDCGYIITFE